MSPVNEPPPSGDSIKPTRRHLRIEQLLLAGSVLLAAIYVTSVLLNRMWIFDLLTHFRVQLAIVMSPLAIGLLLKRRTIWRWSFALFAASAVWSCVEVMIPAQQPQRGGTILRVMSANLLTANSRYEDFERLVTEVNPDMLALIEYTKSWDANLTRTRANYPYSIVLPRAHGFGIAIYSKLPLLNVESEPLLKFFDCPTIFCDVQVDGQRLSVIAIHTISPLTALRFSGRNTQFDGLLQKIKDDPRPRVVIGDFNATTWSSYVQDLLREAPLRDSRQGLGFLPTWPQFFWPMLIPIDHAFVSPQIHVHRRSVECDIGSDHFPIVIDFSISPNNGGQDAVRE